MKKATNTPGVAGFNCDYETSYVVFLPALGKYLHTWTANGWQATLCEKVDDAWQAPTMTTATLIGFCLGFGSGMRIDLVKGHMSLNL